MPPDIVLYVDGFELHAASPDDEPRVRDLEVGRMLGYSSPVDVRKLIRRWSNDLGEVVATVAKTSKAGGRPATEYWLTEEQALFVAAKSETAQGTAILKTLINVFLAARDQLRARPVAVMTTIANGPRMRDAEELRREVDATCRMTARAARVSLARVHGLVRRVACVPTPYAVSMLHWPQVRSMLLDVAEGRVLFAPPRPRALPENVRQLSLFRERRK